jgi:uncharacterized protein with GYD domain
MPSCFSPPTLNRIENGHSKKRRTTVNVYVILLRRMGRQTTPTEPVRLEPNLVSSAAQSNGVQVLDIITCAGIFDAVLVCRAPDNPTVARLLDALEGWHTDALLATLHVRCESASDAATGSTWSGLQ